MTTPADHMTIAEIIHDFATRQGDLTDRWVREDLAAILERRMVAEVDAVLTKFAGLATCLDAGADAASKAYAAGRDDHHAGQAQAFLFAAGELRILTRAEQIRTTETEGAS